MTFKHISDIDSLFTLIDGCAGAVYYCTGSGGQVDLRKNAVVKAVLAEACRKHGIEELSVTVEDKRDVSTFIDYMLYRKFPCPAQAGA